MKRVVIGDIAYTMKTSFAELTEKEILKVSYLRGQRLTEEGQTQQEFDALRIALFTVLTNVPFRITRKILAVEWVDIFPHMNWVFETPCFDGNPVFIIRRRLKKFIGPVGKLDKSTIEEMTHADAAFVSASNNKNLEKMYLLAAILYRPVRTDLVEFRNSSKWNGDIREPFNLEKCKSRIKYFKKLHPYYITYIFLYYWDFRQNHLMKFKRVFSGGSKSSGTNRGWAGTLLELSHLSVFGNIDQIKDQNWFTVLFEMDRQLELQEKREEERIRSTFKK